MADCDGDAVIRSAFFFDDLIGAVFHIVENSFHGLLVVKVPAHFTKFVDADP